MTAPTLTLWQRNLIGLAVAGVAAAVLGVTDMYPHWSAYHARVTPAVLVAKGNTATAYGQTWRLGTVHHLNAVPHAPTVTLPTHTALAVVTIERAGTPPPGECTAVITDGRRRWQTAAIGNGAPLIDGATDRCSRTGPLQLSFLLPSDAVPTAVDLIATDGAILLRITL